MKRRWNCLLSILLILGLMATGALAEPNGDVEVSIEGDMPGLSLNELDIAGNVLDITDGTDELPELQLPGDMAIELEELDLTERDGLAAGGEAPVGNVEEQTDPETTEQATSNPEDFQIDENGVLVKYVGPGGDVVIPDGVTSIGEEAFQRCSLTSVVMPDSVTSIGESAFSGCSELTNINIPDGVTSIGANAFSWSGITSIDLPKGITRIELGVFSLSRLQSITIPDSVTSIGHAAFAECSLTSVVIPDSVTNIEDYAFDGCHLTSVNIPDCITSIEDYTFCGCPLTSITIPDSVTSIGEYAFCGCRSTSISIPDSVISIGNNAFSRCSMTSIILSSHLNRVGKECFASCENLEYVEIPSSITHVFEEDAFKDCGSFELKIVATSSTISDHALLNTSMSRLSIGEGIEIIDEYAFYGNKNLQEVKLPDSLTEIREGAFEQCGMTEITIPRNVKKIGVAAFFDCRQLRTITFGSNLTAVGREAFFGCRKLTTINISKNMTDICDGMFKGCEGIKKIEIPETVGIIGNSAFEACSGLTSVTIANAMGGAASNGAMSNAVTPKKVAIGSSTFKACGGLKKIVIPANVTRIASDAFEGCMRLTIYGEKGSYAQSYAKEHDIPFKAVKLNTPPIAITINQGKKTTLYMGNKLRLNTTIEPAGATTTLSWKSSKPKIASVDKKGLVIPKKAGTAVITVKTANGKTAKITVKVVDASSVKLKEGKSKTLKVGKKLTLHAVVSPSKVKTKYTWKSSDTKVATVTSKGEVVAKKAGTATITVKTANGKKASIKITVK